jgi:hypothetical protein
MKALWIATSLCLASTSALAQSANKTVVNLETCFKLARVTEANCSDPTSDAAQRQECLQNARKVQFECLELAATQAPAPVDRPAAAADAAAPEKPAEVAAPVAATGAIPTPGANPSASASSSPEATPPVNPIAGASADQGKSQPAIAAASAPPEKPAAAMPPVTATTSTSTPAVAQGTNWTVSEMSSPVDYAPVVTAAIRARSENRITPAALVVRCRGGRSELWLRMEGIPRPSRGNEILVAQQTNDQPMVKSRWTASADAKTASYKGDTTALLQSFSEDMRLKIVLSDGSGRDSEAAFQFAGWNAIRDRIAAACMWTSTPSKSSERR